jgi:hypothetical protein
MITLPSGGTARAFTGLFTPEPGSNERSGSPGAASVPLVSAPASSRRLAARM